MGGRPPTRSRPRCKALRKGLEASWHQKSIPPRAQLQEKACKILAPPYTFLDAPHLDSLCSRFHFGGPEYLAGACGSFACRGQAIVEGRLFAQAQSRRRFAVSLPQRRRLQRFIDYFRAI